MPYSPPAIVAPLHIAKPRSGHRRSDTFAIEHPDASGSLRIPPRRAHTRKFHFGDNDNSSADEAQDDPNDAAEDPPTALHLTPVPASPMLDSFPAASPLARAASTPVYGKPLRSVLKSSCSASHVPSHHSKLPPRTILPSAEPSSLSPKSVHFPALDAGLEDIRLFKRSARPASVSLPLSLEETETETETESDAPRIAVWGGKPGSVPFPQGLCAEDARTWHYVLDAPDVPRKADAASMVLVERLWVEDSTASELTLYGTLLVRNAAFEKHVFVRFTLDGWADDEREGEEEPGPEWDRFAFSIRLTEHARSTRRTLELVLAARFYAPCVRAGTVGPYVWCDSLHPPHPHAHVSPSGRAWVGAGAGGPGEWWDNNGGSDYRVGLRCLPVMESGVSVSVPATTQVTNIIPFPSMTPAPTCAPPPSNPTPPPPPAPVPPSALSSAPLSTYQQPSPRPKLFPLTPRTPHARALTAKLGKLSLRNWDYAAPRRTRVPAVSAPVPGHSITTGAAHSAPDDSSDSEVEDADGHASKSDETPPTSPVGAAGLLPAIEELLGKEEGESTSMDEKEGMVEPKDVPLPTSPAPSPSPSPPPTDISPGAACLTASSPKGTPSSSYGALVKQWCFSEAGAGGGGAHVQALLAAWWG
ncbi:CBM21 domain-containing protein [Mycena sanguinolenta]|uniref:CBM21 domain-containing protein n=1 Tax=Mycena sanguinolenta TaxID=230812 RepID=A0A8H7D508_9AGAR|nr:CBM21 domain-containing protein [Mycena sanguinolenta]